MKKQKRKISKKETRRFLQDVANDLRFARATAGVFSHCHGRDPEWTLLHADRPDETAIGIEPLIAEFLVINGFIGKCAEMGDESRYYITPVGTEYLRDNAKTAVVLVQSVSPTTWRVIAAAGSYDSLVDQLVDTMGTQADEMGHDEQEFRAICNAILTDFLNPYSEDYTLLELSPEFEPVFKAAARASSESGAEAFCVEDIAINAQTGLVTEMKFVGKPTVPEVQTRVIEEAWEQEPVGTC